MRVLRRSAKPEAYLINWKNHPIGERSMLQKETVIKDLTSFVATVILEGNDVGLTPSTPLLDHGLIDSLSLAKLLAFIKKEYATEVPNRELRPENLQTLTTVADLVVRVHAKSART
jgi:acyl carrier protein